MSFAINKLKLKSVFVCYLTLTWIGKIKPGHCIEHVQSGVSAREIGGVFVVDDDGWRYDVSDRQNVAENPTQSHAENNLKI